MPVVYSEPQKRPVKIDKKKEGAYTKGRRAHENFISGKIK